MGFLAPWFLAGLAAVGLPVYIHLLRRHTTTPKPVSSLMSLTVRPAARSALAVPPVETSSTP